MTRNKNKLRHYEPVAGQHRLNVFFSIGVYRIFTASISNVMPEGNVFTGACLSISGGTPESPSSRDGVPPVLTWPGGGIPQDEVPPVLGWVPPSQARRG